MFECSDGTAREVLRTATCGASDAQKAVPVASVDVEEESESGTLMYGLSAAFLVFRIHI